jgi:hypothetical protein
MSDIENTEPPQPVANIFEENINVENEYLPIYHHTRYSDYNQLRLINSINATFERSLTEHSPRTETPRELKIPLKPHQAALLHAMDSLELSLRTGLQSPDKTTLYSRYAVLGDAVGAGKSLTILGHIARMKGRQLPSPAYYHRHSTPYMYSTWAGEQQHALTGTLIVIPHSLYRQWSQYITSQTTLKVAFCKTKAFLNDGKTAAEAMAAADAVLVSNTMYEDVQRVATEYGLHWERIFVDEVDNIHIPRNRPLLHADFVWFISATWIPCISASNTYISSSTVDYYIRNGDINLDSVHEDFKANYLAPTMHHSTFLIDSHWHSMAFFSPFLNHHPNRYLLVLRTTDRFRKMSLELPPINVEILKCRASQQQRLVDSVVSPQVREMLHAGDISGALAHLGVTEETPMSLVAAVTANQQKELRRLEATLEFKRGLEYSTPALKETALAALELKITSLKDQINNFQKRVDSIETETCTICFESLATATCVPCCKQLFCGACILEALKYKPTCPLCRTTVNIKDLHIVTKAKTASKRAVVAVADELLKKPDALLKLIQANPNGKFIVFSRYENPFESIETLLEQAGVTVAQIKGNKDVIHSLIDKFRTGVVRVLLLNSQHFATGMNLEAASHVILFHGNMSPNERQQIIGRAHRLGRTGPLTVVQMLHENEE